MIRNKLLGLLSGIGFLLIIPFFQCQSPSQGVPSTTYFFELMDSSSDFRYRDDFPVMRQKIVGKQYAITKNTEQEWPFFQTFRKEHSIPPDSLTPPHVVSHYFPDGSVSSAKEGDYVLHVIFRDPLKGQMNFDLITYQMEGQNLVKIVDTGNHKVPSGQELDNSVKIILRYSFK